MSKNKLLTNYQGQFVVIYLTDGSAYYGYIGDIVDDAWLKFQPISHRDDEQKYQISSTRLLLIDNISSICVSGREFDKIRVAANFANLEGQPVEAITQNTTKLDTFMENLNTYMSELDSRIATYKKEVDES